MKIKILLAAGCIAPLLYCFTAIFGAALTPGYSHIAHAISELTQARAPHQLLLVALFAVYGLLISLFGWGALKLVRRAQKKQYSSIAGPAKGYNALFAANILIIGLGVISAIFGLFPMDPRGDSVTISGTIHLIAAAVTSLGTMAIMVIWGIGDRRIGWNTHALYSIVSVVLVFTSGAIAAFFAAQAHPLMGLVERLTIGLFLQWLFVTALLLLSGRMPEQAISRQP